MEINKKLIIGIALLLLAGLFAFAIARNGAQSHFITGAVLCFLVGAGFLRNSRRP